MSDTALTGTVFDIQHYAVHDGPGIRTLIFLKGCPLRCAWCSNPESQRGQHELRYAQVRCRFCRSCTQSCPFHAVSEAEGALAHDRECCDRCHERPCVDSCPGDALTTIGQAMTVDEVVARAAADVAFYRNSGGGVTISGGEPFAQPEFLLSLLRGCHAHGIHTAVQTCGLVAREVLDLIEPLVDLFLYDLKVIDCERHRALTGAGNELILANLRALADRRPDSTVVRFPLIPGGTDDDGNVDAVVAFTAKLGLAVELEPYHPLGEGKYPALGRSDGWSQVPPVTPDRLQQVATRFTDAGVSCTVM